MNFSELDLLLMLALAVMAWRMSVIRLACRTAEMHASSANKALHMLAVGAAEIIKTEDGYAVSLIEKEKQK